MDAARSQNEAVEPEDAALSPKPSEAEDKPQAWQMIDTGRYMPRRIRGSFLGRELG
jgi:hypothetical protein